MTTNKLPNIYFMQYYNKKHYLIDRDNNRLLLYPLTYKELSKKGFGKITGSMIGYVIDKEKWGQNFKAWCHVFRLKEPMVDMKYVNAGVKIEPKIHQFLTNLYGFEIQTYPAKEYNYDAFKENKVFGGLPDGVDHQNKILFEIKTTGAKSYQEWRKWNKRVVPDGYYYQAALYTYLLGFKKFEIVVGYLNDQDYENPDDVEFSMDQNYAKNYLEIFKFDLPEDIETVWQQVEQWYQEVTDYKEGDQYKISVEFDPKYNEGLIEFLECENYEQRKSLVEKRQKEVEMKNFKI